jgi:Spy/CpxP family protein refolding chaperone
MTDLDPGLDDREPAARRRAGRGWLWAIAPAALVVAGFFLAPTSSTAGVGHWGHRSHGAFGREAHSPEEAKEHAARVAEWVLTLVDGTDAQETEVMAVVTRAIDVLGPVAEQHRANRAAWMEALSAPSVDRERLETLRQQELALAAEASAELVDSLAAVAEVLTPEQRVKLAALAERFPGHSR